MKFMGGWPSYSLPPGKVMVSFIIVFILQKMRKFVLNFLMFWRKDVEALSGLAHTQRKSRSDFAHFHSGVSDQKNSLGILVTHFC